MKLYVVRHGETDANTKNIKQGKDVNGPLTENGVNQISDVVSKVPNDIEIIYSSPLIRVMQSAEIINEELGVEILQRDELKERDFGSITGHAFDEFDNGEELLRLDQNLIYDYRPYGGESVKDVTHRVGKLIQEIKNAQYKNVLTVTSRGPIMILYNLFESRVVTDVPNGSLHTFEI